jgi:hypothetical protein
VELLKSFCHIQDVDTPSEVRERVARALPAAADPQSVQPPILDLLGVLPLDDAFHKVDPIQIADGFTTGSGRCCGTACTAGEEQTSKRKHVA